MIDLLNKSTDKKRTFDAMQVFSKKNNREVILALLQHGPLCGIEIAKITKRDEPTTSRSLKELKKYGFTRSLREGKHIYHVLIA